MGEIVNLRAARKRAKRLEKNRRAEQQRLTHGRAKSTRKLAAARLEKAHRELDAHRIDKGDNQ
jgi:hypothetical protein